MIVGGQWTGLQQAVRNAQALGADLARAEVLEPALLDVGRPLRDGIVADTPRSADAPHVADTFVAKVSKEEASFGRSTVVVGPKGGKGSIGFIAAFLEFGTSKMAARPFIRPRWDQAKGLFPRQFAAAIRKRYDRVVRKYTRKAGFRA